MGDDTTSTHPSLTGGIGGPDLSMLAWPFPPAECLHDHPRIVRESPAVPCYLREVLQISHTFADSVTLRNSPQLADLTRPLDNSV